MSGVGHTFPAPPYKPDRVWQPPGSPHAIPVPYTILWPEGASKPDFKNVDEVRLRRCVKAGLCGVCGQSLRKETEVAFIGGGTSEDMVRAWSVDPPNHVKCAEYASVACPFLARGKKRLDEPENTAPDSGRYYIYVAPMGWRRHPDGVHTQPTRILRRIPINPAAKEEAARGGA